jgi:hypothetical protein
MMSGSRCQPVRRLHPALPTRLRGTSGGSVLAAFARGNRAKREGGRAGWGSDGAATGWSPADAGGAEGSGSGGVEAGGEGGVPGS